MSSIKKKSFQRAPLAMTRLALLLLGAACSGPAPVATTGSTASSVAVSAPTSAASQDADESAATEVGTTVGNPGNYPPSTPAKSVIRFAVTDGAPTSATAWSEDESEDATAATTSAGTTPDTAGSRSSPPVTPSNDFCIPYVGRVDHARTQRCRVTPAEYEIGILAIFLADCRDATGAVSPCSPKTPPTQRFALYNGEQVDLELTTEAVGFSGDLQPLEAGSTFEANGLELVMAYSGQTFPSTGDEAAKIAPHLRGKSFRLCTTPSEYVDAATMARRCGNAEAKFGDILIDMNGDGVYGFAKAATLTDAFLEETPDRAGSAPTYSQVLAHLNGDETPSLHTVTTLDYYDTEGYLSVPVALPESFSLAAEDVHQIDVGFGNVGAMTFVDGLAASAKSGKICVAAVSQLPCPEDNDPASVGQFNPYYDLEIMPKPPNADASITILE